MDDKGEERLDKIIWKFYDNDEVLDLEDTRFLIDLCVWQNGYIEGLKSRIKDWGVTL
jgi:hypothetical protein